MKKTLLLSFYNIFVIVLFYSSYIALTQHLVLRLIFDLWHNKHLKLK